jgi:hypothetical protein
MIDREGRLSQFSIALIGGSSHQRNVTIVVNDTSNKSQCVTATSLTFHSGKGGGGSIRDTFLWVFPVFLDFHLKLCFPHRHKKNFFSLREDFNQLLKGV